MRGQPGNQRQLDLDGVFLGVGHRVEFQPGHADRASRRARSGSDSTSAPGNDQTRWGATAQSAPMGPVFGANDDHPIGNLNPA